MGSLGRHRTPCLLAGPQPQLLLLIGQRCVFRNSDSLGFDRGPPWPIFGSTTASFGSPESRSWPTLAFLWLDCRLLWCKRYVFYIIFYTCLNLDALQILMVLCLKSFSHRSRIHEQLQIQCPSRQAQCFRDLLHRSNMYVQLQVQSPSVKDNK